MNSMFEICREFAIISMKGAIERQLCPLLNLIQCVVRSLDCASNKHSPEVEIMAHMQSLGLVIARQG